MDTVSRINEHPMGEYLRDLFPGIDVAVFTRGKALYIENAIVPDAAQSPSLSSVGTKILLLMTDFADYADIPLIVNAEPVEGYGTDPERLMRVYARWGFTRRKKIKRLQGKCLMYRRPHANKKHGRILL
jgi:hypothetical protein